MKPIVYLGPSLPREEADALLPGADFRKPVSRGDLYRDRERGGGLFLILDGVFFQQQAVPPREILDVLADGAIVAGASSMGALRAAECWPAGLRGIGTIYRLFRRGVLASDDEVALTFDPGDGHVPLSVPLVNVRYALSRAVREKRLDRQRAAGIARAAQEMFYSERTWEAIVDDQSLAAFLAGHDLKRKDAIRALRTVARWLQADPHLASRPRNGQGAFVPSEQHRERIHDALSGADPREIRGPFVRWLLLSGRCAAHLPLIAAAHPELGLSEALEGKELAASILAQRFPEPGAALIRQASLHLALAQVWSAAMAREDAFAEAAWAALTLSGDLDAELFRWRAVRDAAARARDLGLAARPLDRHLAESEIAQAHGYSSWRELRRSVDWPGLAACRDELALAKRLRDRLFAGAPEPSP